MIKGTHVDEGRRADFHPVRSRAPITDEEESQFSLRRLSGAVGLPLGGLKALRENDEVVNQAFHIPHHFLFGRGGDLGDVRHQRPVRHLGQALADDAAALAHFFHSDPVPVVGIAVLPDRHFPFDFVVRVVGFKLSDIIGDAGAPEHGPGEPEVDRVVPGDHRDVPGTGEPDPVRLEQLIVLANAVRKGVEERVHSRHQVRREVTVHASEAIVVEGQPGATQLLEQVQQNFTLSERPEEHGHRADIHRLSPEPK